MAAVPSFVVNFHGIGEPPDKVSSAERRFWVSSCKFQQLIQQIHRLRTKFDIEITFDDGNASDFETAFPALLDANLKAAFFVLADRIGQHGYLSREQIRQMNDAGMEIGLHGARHVDWTQLNTSDLDYELNRSSAPIAAAAGAPVKAVAIPFGKYNGHVLKKIAECGFERIYTSDRGVRLFSGSVRSRFSVREDFDPESLDGLIARSFTLSQRCWSELKFQYKRHR